MIARLVTCFTRYRRSVHLCLGISIRGISPNRRCHFRLTRWPRNSLPSVRSEIRVFSSDSSRRPSGTVCHYLVQDSIEAVRDPSTSFALLTSLIRRKLRRIR